MNLRNYGRLFFTTLLLGGLGGLLVGLILQRDEIFTGSLSNFLVGALMNILVGLTISIVAQMGFFAYMTLNYLALSFLKNVSVWKSIQVFLILFVFFDMVYLRYSLFGDNGSIWPYLIEPTALLFVAVITAYAKVRVTNKTAWIPTMFFMFVVTAIEWIPGIRQNDLNSILFMGVTLLWCNVWQVMQLHRLLKKES